MLKPSFRLGVRPVFNRTLAATVIAASLLGAAAQAQQPAMPRFAGALTFSPEGVLFVGDNIGSTVFAYPVEGTAPAATPALPMKLDQIWSEFDFDGGGPKPAK